MYLQTQKHWKCSAVPLVRWLVALAHGQATLALRHKETKYIFISWNTETEPINIKHLLCERKEEKNREKHRGFKMIKALLRTTRCICWNFCSTICQLWNFKVRIWRHSRWSRYMTPLYFSLSESLTALLAQEYIDVAIPFVPDTFWALTGACRVQLAGQEWQHWTSEHMSGLAAEEGASLLNPLAQGHLHFPPDAFFHDHLSPATLWSWCFHQQFFKTVINMQWIQENKIWYFCLHSLKAAQGCNILQKTSLSFSSAEWYKTNFTPAVKWCLVMLQLCGLGTKKKKEKDLCAQKLPTFSMHVYQLIKHVLSVVSAIEYMTPCLL